MKEEVNRDTISYEWKLIIFGSIFLLGLEIFYRLVFYLGIYSYNKLWQIEVVFDYRSAATALFVAHFCMVSPKEGTNGQLRWLLAICLAGPAMNFIAAWPYVIFFSGRFDYLIALVIIGSAINISIFYIIYWISGSYKVNNHAIFFFKNTIISTVVISTLSVSMYITTSYRDWNHSYAPAESIILLIVFIFIFTKVIGKDMEAVYRGYEESLFLKRSFICLVSSILTVLYREIHLFPIVFY